MGETTIEWTDSTWNPVVGCTRVSEGCRNCYAERMSGRLAAMAAADVKAGRDPGAKAAYQRVVQHQVRVLVRPSISNDFAESGGVSVPVATEDSVPVGRWSNEVAMVADALEIPFGWRKPRRVFVCSMGDLFHEKVPFDYIDEVFAVMALCQQHTFQVLTKRPDRMAEYLKDASGRCVGDSGRCIVRGTVLQPGTSLSRIKWPLLNVWLGTSVENQAAADVRIPELVKCPAAVRFLSCEPLLGPVDLSVWCNRAIQWVIAGGESGPGARPMHPGWARQIRDQCVGAEIPFFFKQWGEWIGISQSVSTGEPVFQVLGDRKNKINEAPAWANGGTCIDNSGKVFKVGADFTSATYPVALVHLVGKGKAGRILDGQVWDQFPAVGEGRGSRGGAESAEGVQR